MLHLLPRTQSSALVLVAILSTVPAAQASEYDVGSIHITQPWSRATPKGAKAGAGYMTITNKGTAPDKVSCVSDDASAECQIHSMTMEGGVMKMRPVEGGLEIKPGETVTLAPSGFQAGFLGLERSWLLLARSYEFTDQADRLLR